MKVSKGINTNGEHVFITGTADKDKRHQYSLWTSNIRPFEP